MIRFERISVDDFDFISKLRNDNRQYFFSNKLITFEDHKKFVESLQSSDDICWIIKYFGNKIGMVSLYNVDKNKATCEFGRFVIEKNHRGLGIGGRVLTSLLWLIGNWGIDGVHISKVYLNVLKTNKKAINLYKKYGFRIMKQYENIICMEKKLNE